MAGAAVPVDLFNPGQVFACLGLLELADLLLGDAHGTFDWPDADEAATRTCSFHVRAAGDEHPVRAALAFLAEAELRSVAPPIEGSSDLTTERWSIPSETPPSGRSFPSPVPSSPATLPALLRREGTEILIDHWADATARDNVKFWAGAGGYPGVALLRDALAMVEARAEESSADPFAVDAPQSSSFRFDWRRDYVPLGVGFSPNEHSDIQPRGYPWVEILAAIGLSNARPQRPVPRDKLTYRYAVPGGPELPIPLHRAALGCAPLPVPRRLFRITLDWPGKAGQARCITDVVEETDE